jgi:hypothetical protein
MIHSSVAVRTFTILIGLSVLTHGINAWAGGGRIQINQARALDLRCGSL